MSYDSTSDTLLHIRRVQALLIAFAAEIIRRGECHDLSKLGAVEKPIRDANPPDISLMYGSPRRAQAVQAIQGAVDHHHKVNSHHPEYYGQRGVSGMDLADLVEMFFDWKAAGERFPADSIGRSIAVNSVKYQLDPQIVAIFENTAKRLGWLEPS